MHLVRRPRGLRLSAAAAVLTFAFTTVAIDFQRVAWAQSPEDAGKQRILLIPMQRAEDVSSVVPGRVNDYLKTIMEMSDSLEVFVPDTLEVPEEDASRAPAEEADKTLQKADDTLWKAKEEAEKGKYMTAAKTFKKAMKLYEKRFAQLNDFDKYVDASLGVALAYFLAGYDDNGEDALAPVLVLRPSLVLDKRKVPKPAIAALQRLQHLYSTAAPGKVVIESAEPGAEVFVDGRRVGQTPHTITGLYRGNHVVRVLAEGYLPWAKSFVASNRDQRIKARLKKDPRAAAAEAIQLVQSPAGLIQASEKGAFGRGFLRLAERISEQYQLDAIVLTYLRRQPNHYELATFVYDRSARKLAELEWIHLDHQLATLQVNLLVLEEKLLAALAAFPKSRVIGETSTIYDKVIPPKPKPAPRPVVIVKPKPKPQPIVVVAKPQPKPVVVVAKPQPRPQPVVIQPRPKPQPRVQPKPQPVVVKPTPKPQPVVVVQPRPRPQPTRVQPTPRAQPEPQPQPRYQPQPQPRAQPKPQPKPQPRPQYQPQPKPQYQPQPQPQPRPANPTVMDVDDGTSKGLGAYDYPSDSPNNVMAPVVYDQADDAEAGAWYEQWWVWVIAGGVVAGGVTAAVLATQPTNDGSSYRMGVCWGGGCQ